MYFQKNEAIRCKSFQIIAKQLSVLNFRVLQLSINPFWKREEGVNETKRRIKF